MRAPATGEAPAAARSWLTLPLLVLAACAALAAGAWGVTRDRGGEHAADVSAVSAAAPAATSPDPTWLPIEGGYLRLDSVSEKATPHHAEHIPLGTSDQIPDDVRRLFVGVSVAAVDGPVLIDPTTFVAAGPGLLAIEPKLADFEAVTVEPGTRLSGYVVFDVPREEQLVEVTVPGLASELTVVSDGELVVPEGATIVPPAPAQHGDDHAQG